MPHPPAARVPAVSDPPPAAAAGPVRLAGYATRAFIAAAALAAVVAGCAGPTGADEAPAILAFTIDENPIATLTEATFSFAVHMPAGVSSTCILDPGDGSDPHVVAPCPVDSSTAHTHAYARSGTYAAHLVARAGEGPAAEATIDVTVTNTAPSASLVASPSEGRAPLEVALDGSGSADPDGSVASWSWDFGDGGGGEGAAVTHTYGEAGTYTVTLTVADDEGATATATAEVTATSGDAPAVTSFSASPATIVTGDVATLSWTVVGTEPLTVTISPAPGDVTGRASAAVSPATTTTYVLLASNAHGEASAEARVTVQRPPDAADDALATVVGDDMLGDLAADNGAGADRLGEPQAVVASFGGGDLGGDPAQHAAGSTVAFAGGDLVVHAGGAIELTGASVPGSHGFTYRLANDAGTSDAIATIRVRDAPLARDDELIVGHDASLAADLLADNGHGADHLGWPDATIATFGGGSLGGTVASHDAGSSVSIAGGTLTLRGDGAASLESPPGGMLEPGTYTVLYRLSNEAAASDGMLTLHVHRPPAASDDGTPTAPAYDAARGTRATFDGPEGVIARNDQAGFPPAAVLAYAAVGGLDGAGATAPGAGHTLPDSGGVTVTFDASGDGSFTVDAGAGSVKTGTYAFDYRIANVEGSSDATAYVRIVDPPTARDDAAGAPASDPLLADLFANNGQGPDHLGHPAAELASFGGGSLGGAVTDLAAGTTADLGGGTLTVNSDGTLALHGAAPGAYTFAYRLSNDAGDSDAHVTLDVSQAPVARQDHVYVPTRSGLSGNLFDDNGHGADDRGHPPALVASYGGTSLDGDSTTYEAGEPTHLGEASLVVHADGAIDVGSHSTPGSYGFSYVLANSEGDSTASVTVEFQHAPDARDDAFAAVAGDTIDGNVFEDNGSGADYVGEPMCGLVSFGGGDLSADTGDHPPGSEVALAGGNLSLASDGALTLQSATVTGTYAFDYRCANGAASSDATVTIDVYTPPVARSDAFVVDEGVAIEGDLFADNGSGADDLGRPAATLVSFGGGSLGGDETSFPAGETVDLGGAWLVVRADGTFSLEAGSTPGFYTFSYVIDNGFASSTGSVSIRVEAAVPTA